MKVLQILFLIFGLTVFAGAQESVLSGTVYDQMKARVVATEISVKESGGKSYKLKSDDSGEYKMKLPFGDYTIEFSQTGFKILRVNNLKIESSVKNLDVNLESGRCEDCNGAIYGKRWDDYAVLSGKVYDANGSLIVGAKVTAINEKGENFETVTNESGIYDLNLPFNPFSSKADFKIAKYEIIVTKESFETNSIKDFKFIPSSEGKMNLDFALEVYVFIDTIIIDSKNQKNRKRKNNK